MYKIEIEPPFNNIKIHSINTIDEIKAHIEDKQKPVKVKYEEISDFCSIDRPKFFLCKTTSNRSLMGFFEMLSFSKDFSFYILEDEPLIFLKEKYCLKVFPEIFIFSF